MPNYPVLSFNKGEVSPQIDARSDIDAYRASCRVLENMIPRIYGPATRRPGTMYIDTTVAGARLIPFIYSNDIAYVTLLEDQRMYFYYNGGQVLDVNGRRLGIDTPYPVGVSFEVQYKQSNDVMWLVHSSYAQRKLTRTTANAFSIDTITFTNGPFKKRNDLAEADGITLTPSVTTGGGTLTASSATFANGHIGALFNVTQPRVNTSVSGTLQATGVLGGTSILTEGPCTLNISDSWSGTIELQRSIDNGVTWEVRRSFYSNDGKRAVQYAFDEKEDNILHRIYVTSYSATYDQQISVTDQDGTVTEETTSKTSKITGDLTVDSSTQTGICRITGFTSSTSVSITVLKTFASTDADTRWAEGCWSTYRGFPRTVTFFEERCVYAGTPHQPQTLWMSAIDDYQNFKAGTDDDSSFSLTISSDTRNAIQWIGALEAILVGTSGGEWRIGTSTDGETLTPTNYTIKQQTSHGSKDMQAVQVGDALLFVDSVGRKIREMSFSGTTYKYHAADLTALAEHITKTGITSVAFQKNPDPILWCTLDDGTPVSMTYEREQNVIAFARHPISRGSQVEGDGTTPTYYTPTDYPTLQVADGVFATTAADPGLTQGTAVSTLLSLQHMEDDLTGNYYLTQDIDASETATWNDGAGFVPIGSVSNKFRGTIDGNGYAIIGLTINRPTEAYCGLVGEIDPTGGVNDVVIANLTLENVSITGKAGGCFIGLVRGDPNYRTLVQNCHITGTSTFIDSGSGGGQGYCGGMAGDVNGNNSASVTAFVDCTTVATLDGTTRPADDMGGFVGHTATNVNYTNCRASGSVDLTGNNIAGGFCGSAEDTVSFVDCSANGTVTADTSAGGFYGEISNGTVTFTRCSARGNVVAVSNIASQSGGFGAVCASVSPTYTDCYAWGSITTVEGGGILAGFLAVQNTPSAVITRCYSIGDITDTDGDGTTGGFIGYEPSAGITTNSYWDTEASGESTSAGGEGHSTTWMQERKNFEDAGYDFDTVWASPDAVTWYESGQGYGTNSIAVIPSSTEDEVWLTITRVINGSTVSYVEQMQPRSVNDIEDMFFVDSGLTYDGVLTTTLSGLGHLEGEEVAILGDGAVVARQTVSSGSITLPDGVNKAQVGLTSTYKLKSMRFDLTSSSDTSKGSVKNIPEVVISFFETLNARCGRDEDNLFNINWRTTEVYGSPPDLFTGDKTVTPDGGFDVEDNVLITGSDPLPCTIRALVPKMNITGR